MSAYKEGRGSAELEPVGSEKDKDDTRALHGGPQASWHCESAHLAHQILTKDPRLIKQFRLSKAHTRRRSLGLNVSRLSCY
eukprot:gene15758-21881_t